MATGIVVLVLAGCSDVVDGTSTVTTSTAPSPSKRSSSPEFPSAAESTAPSPSPTSASTPKPRSSTPAPATVKATRCPTVHYPKARLTFSCILPGLTQSLAGPIWPLIEYRTVDKSGWAMSQGAGAARFGSKVAIAALANSITHDMIAGTSYGPGAKGKTLVDKSIKVDGKAARLRQTTVTLSPAFARSRGTRVRHERLWVLAIRVSKKAVSLWFVSIPDIVSKYWRTVPNLIKSIKVS